MGGSTKNQDFFIGPMNRLVDAVDVESTTKGSGAASKLTVADRLAVNIVSTYRSKSNAPHLSALDDWNTLFTVFFLQCHGYGGWMYGLPPAEPLFANGLGVVVWSAEYWTWTRWWKLRIVLRRKSVERNCTLVGPVTIACLLK